MIKWPSLVQILWSLKGDVVPRLLSLIQMTIWVLFLNTANTTITETDEGIFGLIIFKVKMLKGVPSMCMCSPMTVIFTEPKAK